MRKTSIIEHYKPTPEEITVIETVGIYEGKTKKEYLKHIKIKELIDHTTVAETFKGYLTGYIKITKAEDPEDILTRRELVAVLDSLLLKYKEYEQKGVIKIRGWKGKSSLEVIKHPDKIEIIKYQRKTKNDEPTPIRKELSKEKLNSLITAINACLSKDKITTEDICFFYYNLQGITQTPKGRPLYEGNKFLWDNFYSWRKEHELITGVLEALAYLGNIEYNGGIIKVLKGKIDINEVLE